MKSKRKEPNFTQEQFKKTLQKAHEIYFSWEKEFHCPYFDETIKITRSGWTHLLTEKRPKHQKYWRAKHFTYIPEIIQKTTTLQKETLRHSSAGKIRHWSFVSLEDGIALEVVIRQIENQPNHFYSFVYKGLSPRIMTN